MRLHPERGARQVVVQRIPAVRGRPDDQREHVRESEGGHCREYDQDGWWRKLRPGMRKARRTSQHPHGGRAEKGEDERCEDAAARERVERREEERERDDFCEADGKGG